MAHGERPLARALEEAAEVRPIALVGGEGSHATEAVVDADAAGCRLARHAGGEHRHEQGLGHLDAALDDGRRRFVTVAHPGAVRVEQPLVEGGEERGAHLRQDVDVLVAVDEVGNSPEDLPESADLTPDLRLDLPIGKSGREGLGQDAAEARRPSVGREARHGSDRRQIGEREVQSDVGAGSERGEPRRIAFEGLARDHAAGRGQAARVDQRQDGLVDLARQAEVVGAQHEIAQHRRLTHRLVPPGLSPRHPLASPSPLTDPGLGGDTCRRPHLAGYIIRAFRGKENRHDPRSGDAA